MVGWVGGGMVVTNRTYWDGNNHWERFSGLVSRIKHIEILITLNWTFQVPEIGDFRYLKLEISGAWNWAKFVVKITCQSRDLTFPRITRIVQCWCCHWPVLTTESSAGPTGQGRLMRSVSLCLVFRLWCTALWQARHIVSNTGITPTTVLSH